MGKDIMAAIRTGDTGALRDCLRNDPSAVNDKLAWEHYDGYPLNYAAFCNQPDIIGVLVIEYGADPNRNDSVGSNWTPLHHAQEKKSCEAAGVLLSLGADPGIRSSDNKTTDNFCNTSEVQRYRDLRYADRLKERVAAEKQLREDTARAEAERRRAGTWSRTADREITHDYEMPDLGCTLKDIFNFETRIFRSVAKSDHGLAQNIIFFDDMPDKEILREPAQKLKDFGADVGENEIAGGRILKKSLTPKS